MGSIRLACLFCDREDGDGIDFVPSDWLDVDEVQSYEDSVEVDVSTEGVFSGWWTHIGVCPDCQETRFRPTDEASIAS